MQARRIKRGWIQRAIRRTRIGFASLQRGEMPRCLSSVARGMRPKLMRHSILWLSTVVASLLVWIILARVLAMAGS